MNGQLLLSELMRTRKWDAYRGDRLGNQLAIDDPERFDRLMNGGESTREEELEDLLCFIATLDTISLENFDPTDVDDAEEMERLIDMFFTDRLDNEGILFEHHQTLILLRINELEREEVIA